MKNSVYLSIFLVFMTFTIHAQSEFRLGVKGGVNFASVGGDFTNNTRGVFEYHLGGLAEFPVVTNLTFQPELLFSAQGSEHNTMATDGPRIITKLNYINLPLMAKYYLIDNFSVMGGPQLGYLVSAKNEITSSGFSGRSTTQENDLKDDISNFDFGLGIGAEYRLDLGIFVQLRYVIGMSNVNATEGVVLGYHRTSYDVKSINNVLQISAGYSF
ncbi:porin family protein [Aequorivita xiaoshiensis]|uniref:PorT family protein n=1 Tax=Aequorivita xiaoshiensis TaxID=2874476 RepID=A0A9X1U6N4_9FLAO|nr:porin family protein [Aequorivita xiaoshiensis]MCG2431397.1 PorT family protein [Aequorivita xiaoshiensis]